MLNSRSASAWLLVFTQAWMPVLSQTLPISVDKSIPHQRPIVTKADNGVPVVNIAPPTAAGVSNNRFQQFNVGPSGVVFNNSGAPSQSQLAGGIAGNPMLGNGRAAVIINQITANNPSQLRGMMEVAGHRANVIIANPAGITCNGCGFLNAHRGTLTTGRPMIGADGGLQGFDITRGRISVEGQGLLGNGVDKVDLIARTLVLNAAVWANRLNVVAGPATVGYGDDSVQPKAGEGPAPAVWLDVAALGGMYAGAIRLVGTEAGVGVNLGGPLNSLTGQLHLTSAGDVRILPAGEVYGAAGVKLSADGKLAVQGKVTAPRDVHLTARQGLRVDGTVATTEGAGLTLYGHDIDIGATGKVHSGAALLADARGRLDSAGDVRAAGKVTLRSAGTMTLAGTTVSEMGDVHLQSLAQGIAMAPSAHTRAAGTLYAVAQGTLLTDGQLVSEQSATLHAGGNLENRGKLEVRAGFTLAAAGTLINGGELLTPQSATLRAQGNLQNHGLLRANAGAILWTAGALINHGGQVASEGDVRLDVQGAVDNRAGTIHSNGKLYSGGTEVNNRGGTLRGRDLQINTPGRIDNIDGLIHAIDKLDLSASSVVNRDTIRRESEPARGIRGKVVDLRADIIDNNRGDLQVDDHLTMNGKRLRNVGGLVISRGGIIDLTMTGEADAFDASRDGTIRKRRSAPAVLGAGNTPEAVAHLAAPAGTVLDNRGGKILAAKDIALDLIGELDNASGQIRAGGRLHGKADAVNNQRGALIGHGVEIATAGEIDNRGGRIDAAGGGLSLSASRIVNTDTRTSETAPKLGILGKTVSLNASVIGNVGGTIIGDQHVTINGKRLRNGGGLVKSWDGIDITMTEAVGLSTDAAARSRRSAPGDDVADSALDNHDGRIAGGGDVTLDIGGGLNNRSGTISSAKKLDVDASAVQNQGGTAQARDVKIKTPGRIDNAEGLIQAEETLALAGDSVGNAKTKKPHTASSEAEASEPGSSEVGSSEAASTKGDSPETETAHGIIGKQVSIGARDIDNTDGQISATKFLEINGETLHNTDGVATSHGTAEIDVGTLENERGKVWSAKGSSVKTQRMTGTGKIASQGDIDFESKESVRHTGEIVADGKVSVRVADGNLHNSGTISSGSHATVIADEIDNEGEIVSGGTTTVRAKKRISNPGLINGIETALSAPLIENTGRIYGDWIKIEADALRNGRRPSDPGENRKAGAIAAHARIDMGVGTFDNDHGEVYTGGDLSLGRHLDAAGNAVGWADVLNNRSGLIDVDGNLLVNAAIINNLNEHFVTELVPGTTTRKVYYRRDGEDEKLDADKYWLCNYDKPVCTKNYKWVLRTSQRRLLMPSPKYTEPQYGPELTYAQRKHASFGKGQAPVQLPYSPSFEQEVSGENRVTVAEQFHYPVDAPLWDVFEVPRPAPVPPLPDEGCRPTDKCQAERDAHAKAHTAKVAAYQELNERVRAFNLDFKKRLVSQFTIYDLNETVSETHMVSSAPAKILVGRDATFGGKVVNDKSQIIAGGLLDAAGNRVQNIGATGERRTETSGQVIHTYTKKRGRKHKTAPYRGAPEIETIELAVATYVPNIRKPAGTRTIPATRPPSAGTAPFETFSLRVPGMGEVRTVASPFSLPSSALYTLAQEASSAYLVNTDPHFAGRRSLVSSDYLFELLGSKVGAGGYAPPTPPTQPDALRFARPPSGPSYVEGFNGALMLKRLGDAFYEQRLVAQQVMAATGQRFIGDYQDNQSQYKALLTAGAAFGKQHGLTVGTALTEDQMRHLTSDMVWMVKRDVPLPDGTTQTVLAPQVYLMVRDGDLKGDGTLMAGRRVRIEAEDRVENSGTLAARDALAITGKNIVLRDGGTVRGDTVELWGRRDLDNLGAVVRGKEVFLGAGRDVNLMSTTGESAADASQSTGKGPYAETRRTYISGVSRIQAQSLAIQAGRHVNLKAARVDVDGDARIRAENDINLLSVRETYGESVVYRKRNTSRVEHATDVGTVIRTNGNLMFSTGRDLNAEVADVTAGGKLGLDAGRDINLLDGRETGYARDEHYAKYKSGWSTVRKHSIDTTTSDQSRASTFTGDSVEMNAGRDILVRGSNVGAQGDLTLRADRDMTIEAGQNTSAEDHYRLKKRSGWGATGGLSNGMRQSLTTLEGEGVMYTPSVVGSVEGEVRIDVEGGLDVKGSHVLAKKGGIDATARDIDISIVTARDREKRLHEFKESGFRISLGVPLLDSLESIDRMATASSKVDNPIMKALAIGTIGGIVANTAQEVATNGLSATITLDYGGTREATTVNRQSTDVVGSTVAAGNDLTLTAKGGGQDSDITVTGSTVAAGGNATLDAQGDLLLQAAANTATQRTEKSSVDGKIGVGVQFGVSNGGYGYGFIVKGSIAASEGWHEGMRKRWTASSVSAGRDATLRSGGDTSLRGGKVKGEHIKVRTDGNLLLESLQDEHTYNAESKFANAGFTACLGYCTSSAYASAGFGQINSDYQSVSNQTGMWAGARGFDVDVGKNTRLKGAVIASDPQAVEAGVNRLSTGTLVAKNIENGAKYDAYQVSVGAGSGGDGVGGAMPGGALAFDNARSITRSAISGGALTIRDIEGQVALTGDTVEEMLASLDRDTSDTTNTLRPIFDRDKVQAGLDVVTEATKQAGTFLANTAREIDALEKTANDENVPPPVRERAAAQAKALRDNWGPGGTYRRVLGAILAGMSGNAAAGGVQMMQAATVAYIQSLAASGVKDIADAMGKGPQAEVARAALHTIVGCAGAAASQASCGAGAMGAGASSILNSLGDEIRRREAAKDPGDAKPDSQGKQMTASQQETWRNTVAALVTGIAAASGTNPATVMSAAVIETENNYLNASEEVERVAAKRRLKQCRDAACRDAEQAQLTRLAKISEDRNYRVETLPEDKSVYSAALREIEQDMDGLAVMAKSSNVEEAKAAHEQIQQAGNKYRTVLGEQKELAIRQNNVVRDEQLVEYGYLTERQAEVLENGPSEFVKELLSKAMEVGGAGAGAGAGANVAQGAAGVAKKTAAASNTGKGAGAPNAASQVAEGSASSPIKGGSKGAPEGGIKEAKSPEAPPGIGTKGTLPGNQTVDQFEESIFRLPPGERVARIKSMAVSVTAANGMVKDKRLSKLNARDVYRASDGRLYALDTQHGRFEVIHPKTGKHLGEVDFSFKETQPADRSGGHNIRVK
jgi:filamentous hemagglutinin